MDDDDGVASVDVDDPEDFPLMYGGDVVGAKATIDVLIDGREHWFTYEARTRVQPGESEEQANERIQLVCNVRAIELADDMAERLAVRAASRLQAPIRPRQ